MSKTSDKLHSGNRVGIPRARARFLTQARQLEESSAPGVASAGVFLTVLLIVGAIAWASLTELSEVSRSAGEVVPTGLVQKIQHLEGGLIKSIHVKNGDAVKAGDQLLSLNPAIARAELEQLETRKASLVLESIRLKSLLRDTPANFDGYAADYPMLVEAKRELFVNQRAAHAEQHGLSVTQVARKIADLAALDGQIKATEDEIVLLEELEAIQSTLADERLVARVDLINVTVRLTDAKRERAKLLGSQTIAQSAFAEALQQQAESKTRLRERLSIELSEVSSELADVEQSMSRTRGRIERVELRAPVDGIVKGLTVNTIAEVIEPGQILMEIVPTAPELIVESKVSTTDIGHVRIGQKVDVKVTSFESTRFGTVVGVVSGLSASTYLDTDKTPFYRAEISLERDYLGTDPAFNKIIPGMTVQADIVTGRKSVLDYILKPVYRGFQTAFTER